MEVENKKYREIHGVLKEVDFVNFSKPYDNIIETPVEHSKYASSEGAKKSGFGNTIKGLFKIGVGLIGATSGAGWLGADIAGDGLGQMAKGVTNRAITSELAAMVTNEVIAYEKAAWKYLNFLTKFIPASGNIGDVVFKDGSCDDFHCGNGHKFFENGDYFEGYFEDGEIKKGVYIWNTGDRYIGEFDEEFRKTGRGLTLFANGTYYFGDYLNGTRTGVGIQLYEDGIYCGEWLYDERKLGALRTIDGACFLGDFENDQPVY